MTAVWVDWQRNHAAALAALQEAQRAYHRGVVGADSQQSPVGSQQSLRQETLDALDEARTRLDQVRARMPR